MHSATPDWMHRRSDLERRLLYMALGMSFGLLMGLLVWFVDLFIAGPHHVVLITLGLMALEGMIGFFVAGGDKGKLDDLLSFIIAFFIVP